MIKLVRLFVLTLLAPLAFALAYEAYQFLRSDIPLQEAEWFLYGLGFYFALYVTLLAKRIRFLEVLEHELAHTIVSLAFFKVPESLKAHRAEGGEVEPIGGDFLSCLAPYYLPLVTVPLLLIKPFICETFDKALDFVIGFTVAFHYGGLSREFRLSQPDFKNMGRFFSIIITLVFNAVWLVIILCVVTENHPSILVYFEKVYARTQALYELILEAKRAGEVPALKDLIERLAPVVESGGYWAHQAQT